MIHVFKMHESINASVIHVSMIHTPMEHVSMIHTPMKHVSLMQRSMIYVSPMLVYNVKCICDACLCDAFIYDVACFGYPPYELRPVD